MFSYLSFEGNGSSLVLFEERVELLISLADKQKQMVLNFTSEDLLGGLERKNTTFTYTASYFVPHFHNKSNMNITALELIKAIYRA